MKDKNKPLTPRERVTRVLMILLVIVLLCLLLTVFPLELLLQV